MRKIQIVIVSLILGMSVCFVSCDVENNTEKQDLKSTQEIDQVKQSDTVEDDILDETEQSLVEVIPIEFKFSNSYYEQVVSGKLLGNNLTVKLRHTNDTTLEGFSVDLTDDECTLLMDILDKSQDDLDVAAILELDLTNMVKHNAYNLLYYYYWFGNVEEKQLAEEQLVLVDEDYDKVVKHNIELKNIETFLSSDLYQNASLEERKESALILLDDLNKKGVIGTYNRGSDDYVIEYEDAYGYSTGLTLKDFDTGLN